MFVIGYRLVSRWRIINYWLKHDGMIVRIPRSLLLALTSKFYFAKIYTVYTVYFEKCWWLNTSQTENKFLVTFAFSRSYAVLFLVKNMTSETSSWLGSRKRAPDNTLWALISIILTLYCQYNGDQWLWGQIPAVRVLPCRHCGVSWPSGLACRTQVLVLAAECGFESRPWHLCPWARHLIIIASLYPGVKWVPVKAELVD